MAYCSPLGAEFMDDQRFAALEEKCKSAREYVVAALPTSTIDVEDTPWSGVYNEASAPHAISVQLMVEPKVVGTINLRYVDDVNSSNECRGRFVTVVRGLDSMPKSVKCTERTRWESVPSADVLVSVEHGQLDKDIRPLALKIIHLPSGRVLAEQLTYELLLGHMHSSKNRQWYGMGSSQVSRSCKLTSPRTFIARALGKS
jgi:hypothetical protein